MDRFVVRHSADFRGMAAEEEARASPLKRGRPTAGAGVGVGVGADVGVGVGAGRASCGSGSEGEEARLRTPVGARAGGGRQAECETPATPGTGGAPIEVGEDTESESEWEEGGEGGVRQRRGASLLRAAPVAPVEVDPAEGIGPLLAKLLTEACQRDADRKVNGQPPIEYNVSARGENGRRGDWSTPEQRELLEALFAEGTTVGPRDRAGGRKTHIANALSHLGPVTEFNVYFWFESRRRPEHPLNVRAEAKRLVTEEVGGVGLLGADAGIDEMREALADEEAAIARLVERQTGKGERMYGGESAGSMRDLVALVGALRASPESLAATCGVHSGLCAALVHESSLGLRALAERVMEVQREYAHIDGAEGAEAFERAIATLAHRVAYGVTAAAQDEQDEDGLPGALYRWELRDLQLLPGAWRITAGKRRRLRQLMHKRLKALEALGEMLDLVLGEEPDAPDPGAIRAALRELGDADGAATRALVDAFRQRRAPTIASSASPKASRTREEYIAELRAKKELKEQARRAEAEERRRVAEEERSAREAAKQAEAAARQFERQREADERRAAKEKEEASKRAAIAERERLRLEKKAAKEKENAERSAARQKQLADWKAEREAKRAAIEQRERERLEKKAAKEREEAERRATGRVGGGGVGGGGGGRSGLQKAAKGTKGLQDFVLFGAGASIDGRGSAEEREAAERSREATRMRGLLPGETLAALAVRAAGMDKVLGLNPGGAEVEEAGGTHTPGGVSSGSPAHEPSQEGVRALMVQLRAAHEGAEQLPLRRRSAEQRAELPRLKFFRFLAEPTGYGDDEMTTLEWDNASEWYENHAYYGTKRFWVDGSAEAEGLAGGRRPLGQCSLVDYDIDSDDERGEEDAEDLEEDDLDEDEEEEEEEEDPDDSQFLVTEEWVDSLDNEDIIKDDSLINPFGPTQAVADKFAKLGERFRKGGKTFIFSLIFEAEDCAAGEMRDVDILGAFATKRLTDDTPIEDAAARAAREEEYKEEVIRREEERVQRKRRLELERKNEKKRLRQEERPESRGEGSDDDDMDKGGDLPAPSRALSEAQMQRAAMAEAKRAAMAKVKADKEAKAATERRIREEARKEVMEREAKRVQEEREERRRKEEEARRFKEEVKRSCAEAVQAATNPPSPTLDKLLEEMHARDKAALEKGLEPEPKNVRTLDGKNSGRKELWSCTQEMSDYLEMLYHENPFVGTKNTGEGGSRKEPSRSELIACALSHLGKINDNNVYYWFEQRRRPEHRLNMADPTYRPPSLLRKELIASIHEAHGLPPPGKGGAVAAGGAKRGRTITDPSDAMDDQDRGAFVPVSYDPISDEGQPLQYLKFCGVAETRSAANLKGVPLVPYAQISEEALQLGFPALATLFAPEKMAECDVPFTAVGHDGLRAPGASHGRTYMFKFQSGAFASGGAKICGQWEDFVRDSGLQSGDTVEFYRPPFGHRLEVIARMDLPQRSKEYTIQQQPLAQALQDVRITIAEAVRSLDEDFSPLPKRAHLEENGATAVGVAPSPAIEVINISSETEDEDEGDQVLTN